MRFLARKIAAAGDQRDHQHHRSRHQASRHKAAEKHRADRSIGDQRVEDHRDRGRHQRAERRRNHRGRGGKTWRITALLRHHPRQHQTRARRVRDRAAAHAGKDQIGDDIHLREAARQMADHGGAEAQQPLDHAARIHHIGDEDEHRHGDEQIAVVEAVHGLVDDQADVLMRRDQIDIACGEHGEAERRAEHSREREHAEQDPQTYGHGAPLFRCDRASARRAIVALRTARARSSRRGRCRSRNRPNRAAD